MSKKERKRERELYPITYTQPTVQHWLLLHRIYSAKTGTTKLISSYKNKPENFHTRTSVQDTSRHSPRKPPWINADGCLPASFSLFVNITAIFRNGNSPFSKQEVLYRKRSRHVRISLWLALSQIVSIVCFPIFNQIEEDVETKTRTF